MNHTADRLLVLQGLSLLNTFEHVVYINPRLYRELCLHFSECVARVRLSEKLAWVRVLDGESLSRLGFECY